MTNSVEENKVLEPKNDNQVNKVESSESAKPYTVFSVIGFIGVITSISMGFYKLFVYENGESIFDESKNAYVGGDAYNYIINGTQATSYFVLALTFMVFTSTMMLLNKLSKK